MSHPHRGKARREGNRTPQPAEIAHAQLGLDWTDQRCADACCVSPATWRQRLVQRDPEKATFVGAWTTAPAGFCWNVHDARSRRMAREAHLEPTVKPPPV
jgi:hypothetical protein